MDQSNDFPEIQTARTRLRQLSLNDADDLFEIYSDAAAMQYRENPPFKTRKEAVDAIVQYGKDFINGIAMRWAVELKENGKVIGTFLWKMSSEQNEIGYSLGKKYRQHGLMFEILQAMADFLFQTEELDVLTAKVKVENTASHQLLKKCGFKISDQNPGYIKYRMTITAWERR